MSRTLWIVPPHRDATLTPVAPAGAEVLDLQAAFAARCLSQETLAAAVSAHLPGQGAQRLFELEAARKILARAQTPQAVLRAQGVALAALTADGPLQVRLDDVELAWGTTERSADLHAFAARADTPFEAELSTAVAASRGADELRLVVDCDQRLPFVFTLLRRLDARPERVLLCGAFAHRHRAALLEALPGVEITADALAFRFGDGAWVWDGGAPPEEGRWRGYVPLPALASLTDACQVAVVSFAALEADRVLSTGGEWFPRSVLTEAAEGRTLVGEWQFGAPGVDKALAESTVGRLLAMHAWRFGEDSPFGTDPLGAGRRFTWLAGVRRFHYPVDRAPVERFGDQPLTLAPPEPSRDLARSRHGEAPGTLEEEPLELLVRRALHALNEGPMPPSPGRVAAGLCAVPPPLPPVTGKAERIQLSPDAALVELPFNVAGEAKRTLVAVSVRTGTMLGLDARLVPFLSRLEQPIQPGDFMPGVAAAMREKLLKTLLEKKILQEVSR